MKPLNSNTLAPDITKCIIPLCIKNIFSNPPTTRTISPAIKNPDMKLKSFLEMTTYKLKLTKVIAVRAKASAAIVGPTLINIGPNVNPETVVIAPISVVPPLFEVAPATVSIVSPAFSSKMRTVVPDAIPVTVEEV